MVLFILLLLQGRKEERGGMEIEEKKMRRERSGRKHHHSFTINIAKISDCVLAASPISSTSFVAHETAAARFSIRGITSAFQFVSNLIQMHLRVRAIPITRGSETPGYNAAEKRWRWNMVRDTITIVCTLPRLHLTWRCRISHKSIFPWLPEPHSSSSHLQKAGRHYSKPEKCRRQLFSDSRLKHLLIFPANQSSMLPRHIAWWNWLNQQTPVLLSWMNNWFSFPCLIKDLFLIILYVSPPSLSIFITS